MRANRQLSMQPFSEFPGYKIRRWPPADWPTGQAADSLAGVAYTEISEISAPQLSRNCPELQS